jgi:hypothetical protein
MQELVRQLLDALEAEVQPAQHQQRRDGLGRQRADGQRRGTRISLLRSEPFAHRPDHRQFALGAHAGDLLRVQRQIVAEHAGGLLRRDLGHHRHIV